MWDKRAQLVRVKDGDTFVAVLDQGFRQTLEIDVRLLGVYAPEKGEPGWAECTNFTADWLGREAASGATWPFVVTTVRMARTDREQTTLERYLCTVTSLDSTRHLNAELVEFIHAAGYGPGDT